MVKANNPWLSSQHSYRQLPDLNCMSTLLETRQQECLPSLTDLGTCKCSGQVPFPGSTGPRLKSLGTERINEANTLPGFATDFHALLSTPSPYVDGKKYAFPYGLSGMIVPGATFSGLYQKGFLIFDQSENHTKLTYKYISPSIQNPSTASARPVSGYDELHKAGIAAQVDPIDRTKNISRQASDGNDESEMHEDTEEINALLDSDNEDEENDSDNEYGEDDEVTSTAHSPTQVKEDNRKQEQVHKLTEEVASSDGPNKRQKMLDGGYDKSSPFYSASSVKLDESHEYENDAKSGCADGPDFAEGSECTFGNMRSKKDKIREILRVLESIIPGVEGKDPLLVIDEAIDYLRITKIKAETPGVSFH